MNWEIKLKNKMENMKEENLIIWVKHLETLRNDIEEMTYYKELSEEIETFTKKDLKFIL